MYPGREAREGCRPVSEANKRQSMPSITRDAFRDEASEFLDTHCERRVEEAAFEWGKGSDRVGMFEERSRDAEQALVARAQQWRNTLFDAGFGWIAGPTEYGGRGLS